MQIWHKEACEQIDAGLFSSDSFHNSKAIEDIDYYIQRWLKEVKNIKQMLNQVRDAEHPA